MSDEHQPESLDETIEMGHESLDEGLTAEAPPAEAKPGGKQAPPITARTELPFGLVFLLLLALLVVVFTVQNTADVSVQFLAWSGRFPLAVVIIAVVVATVVVDEVAGVFLRRRRRRRAAEKQELRRLRESQ